MSNTTLQIRDFLDLVGKLIALNIVLLLGPIPLIGGAWLLLGICAWRGWDLRFKESPKVGGHLRAILTQKKGSAVAQNSRVSISLRLSCLCVKGKYLPLSTRTGSFTPAYFDKVIWTDVKRFEMQEGDPEILFEIQLPEHLAPSSSEEDEPRQGHFWVLEIKRFVFGIPAKRRFTVPVMPPDPV